MNGWQFFLLCTYYFYLYAKLSEFKELVVSNQRKQHKNADNVYMIVTSLEFLIHM